MLLETSSHDGNDCIIISDLKKHSQIVWPYFSNWGWWSAVWNRFSRRESFHPTAFLGILGPFPDLDFLVARGEHFCNDEVLHNQTASLKGCRLYMGLAEFSCNLVRIWRLFWRHNDTKPSWDTYVRRFGHPQTWNLVILHGTSWWLWIPDITSYSQHLQVLKAASDDDEGKAGSWCPGTAGATFTGEACSLIVGTHLALKSCC